MNAPYALPGAASWPATAAIIDVKAVGCKVVVLQVDLIVELVEAPHMMLVDLPGECGVVWWAAEQQPQQLITHS